MSSLDFWSQRNAQSFDLLAANDKPNRIVVMVPTKTECTATGCGLDRQTLSAKRADCLVCGGAGYTIVWVANSVVGRLQWANVVTLNYQFPSSGIEMGDCVITVDNANYTVLQQVFEDEDAYIIADGKTVRPKSDQTQVIGNIMEEYQIVCNRYTPGSKAN